MEGDAEVGGGVFDFGGGAGAFGEHGIEEAACGVEECGAAVVVSGEGLEGGAREGSAPLDGEVIEAVGDGQGRGADGEERADARGEAGSGEDGVGDGAVCAGGVAGGVEGVGGNVAEGDDGGACAVGEQVELGEVGSRGGGGGPGIGGGGDCQRERRAGWEAGRSESRSSR